MSPAGEPDGRVRAVIDAVRPAVDGGRFAVKRVAGEALEVEAHCFADGHDVLRARLLWRAEDARDWQELEMKPLGNDVWRAQFTPTEIGRYRYSAAAWVDAFATWRHDFARREDPADQALAALAGAYLAEEAAARAKGADAQQLKDWAARLRAAKKTDEIRATALDEVMCALAMRYPDRSLEARWHADMPLVVDRKRDARNKREKKSENRDAQRRPERCHQRREIDGQRGENRRRRGQ
jgi:starch synthase (maltosyl-transferring)